MIINKQFIFNKIQKKEYLLNNIKSFVIRKGRLTKRQKYAINTIWPIFGIEYQEKQFDFNLVFDKISPIILEIGFGMGQSLINMACSNPNKNFIGIEVYPPGIGSCLFNIKKNNIKNLRILYHDAVLILKNMILDKSISIIQLFFPDPWQKKKHNKRRIIQYKFIELISNKLSKNGIFHIVTDWEPYAEHILITISNSNFFYNVTLNDSYSHIIKNRPLTKFEQRGRKLGYKIWDFIFKKIN